MQVISNISVTNSSIFNHSEKVQKSACSGYELSNHLGNVLAVITDRRIQTCGMGDVMHYEAQMVSISDYYPFGMGIKDREWKDSTFSYRFGFNGKEKDDEVNGAGNCYDYGFRIYNPRLGRFLSVDPLFKTFPWYTPYQYAGNKPITCIDLDGLEDMEVVTTYPTGDPTLSKTIINVTMTYKVVMSGVGAMSAHNIPNPTAFHNLWAKGNTVLYMKSLPSHGKEGEFLEGKERRWAKKAHNGSAKYKEKLKSKGIIAHKVEVRYDYNLDISTANSLESSNEWMNENAKGRGIIVEEVDFRSLNKEKHPQVWRMMQIANSAFKNKSVGGIASNDNPDLINTLFYYDKNSNAQSIDQNIIIMPKETEMTTSPTIRMVHESGHNAARKHIHESGQNYEYDTPGLSNNGNNPSPSISNSKNIINDKTNRQKVFPTRIGK